MRTNQPSKFDALVKSPKSPFDKLRANGGLVEIIDYFPFVVSLSNHTKTFYDFIKFKAQNSHFAAFVLLTACCLLLTDIALAATDDSGKGASHAYLTDSDEFRKRGSQGKESKDSFEEGDDIKAEIVFGRELAARILGRYKLYKDEALTRYVNMVGKGVASFANRPEIEFRFGVLDSDMVNAFAAPGGYIFITKGALKMMKDEAELSAVLAHEVAHVSERHIVRELNIKGTDESPAAGFARVLGGSGDTMRAVFTQMVDKAVEILLEKGLKKQDEMDSDRISTTIITNAGYDATALKRFLIKISAADGNSTKVLTGTHPAFEERVKGIDKVLADNQLTDKGQPVVKERFSENVSIK